MSADYRVTYGRSVECGFYAAHANCIARLIVATTRTIYVCPCACHEAQRQARNTPTGGQHVAGLRLP